MIRPLGYLCFFSGIPGALAVHFAVLIMHGELAFALLWTPLALLGLPFTPLFWLGYYILKKTERGF